MMSLWDVAKELSRRLESIFLRDEKGRRPVYGGAEKFQTDPHWRDLMSFYEYFHGDNGAGIGASHQTGWTALVAKLMLQTVGWRDEAARAPERDAGPPDVRRVSKSARRHGAGDPGGRRGLALPRPAREARRCSPRARGHLRLPDERGELTEHTSASSSRTWWPARRPRSRSSRPRQARREDARQPDLAARAIANGRIVELWEYVWDLDAVEDFWS